MTAVIWLLFLSPSFAAKDIFQEALATLPQKKLNLDFVVQQAIANSDSYNSLTSLKVSSEGLSSLAEAPFDWVFNGNYSQSKGTPDVNNPFSPNSFEKRNWGLGLSKNFSTGTFLSAQYGSGFNKIGFSNPAISIPDYYEDTVNLSFTQNLWSNFFGNSLANSLKANRLKSEAQLLEFQEAKEAWVVDLIQLYYNSWLSQNQYYAAKESVERRKKLLNVVQSKLERGTSEKPDFLQVKSAYLVSQNQLSKATADLNEIWKNLVVTLKLPNAWMTIDPSRIPMTVDAFQKNELLCKSEIDFSNTVSVQKAKKYFEASDFNLKKAASDNSPKLDLKGSYSANGIDPSSSLARSEAFDRNHPSWNLGLYFELPIGFSQALGQEQLARADFIKSKSIYDSSLDKKRVEIMSLCERLQKAEFELQNAKQAYDFQKERLDLEEKRFQVGRTSTFNVIQAGDDKSQAEINKNLAEVNLRVNQWKLLRAGSQLSEVISRWER